MTGSLQALLQQTLRVRPDEARRTGLSCLYLFSAIGAFILARMTRDALILEIPDYKLQLPLATNVLRGRSISQLISRARRR